MRTSDSIVRSLSRVTRSGNLIPEIDGLRFVAILAVILTHIASTLGREVAARGDLDLVVLGAFEAGTAGVQLFFAISGFILGLPFAEAALNGGRPVKLPKYYQRRVMRIEPPYLINLTLLLGLALLVHGSGRFGRISHYIASLFYLHNLTYNSWSEINFVAWSLEVEVQFYLIAPLLALVFRIEAAPLRRGLIAGMILASAAAAVVASGLSYGLRCLIVFHLSYFLVGFLLADFFSTSWRGRAHRSGLWDLLAVAGLVGFFAVARVPGHDFVMPPLLFLVCGGALNGDLWKRALSNRWVVVFGGMCYTIYLYHFWIWKIAHAILARLLPSLPLWGSLLAESVFAVPLILVACAPLFLLFEKPFMYPDWPSRVARAVRSWLSPLGLSKARAEGTRSALDRDAR